jgi:splicing factor 3A subunit 1
MNQLVLINHSSAVIDKTASFVARLGIDFEKKIFDNERNNPKFSFLLQHDRFFSYYQRRIEDFREEFGKFAR